MKYILTAQGERYMARVNAEMIPMNLTRVQVGSGTAENPGELTEMVDPKQKIQIDSREHDGTQAILHCMLTNVEVEEEYLLQQAGVFAFDPIDDQEYLVIIGQDEQGERVPPGSEKMVEWIINIAWKVSSAAEITFDISVNDFVRKGYLQEQLAGLRKVVIGPENTELENDTILLIVEEVPQEFDAVAYDNILFGDSPPEGSAENWADTGETSRASGMAEGSGMKILTGKLTVGAEPEEDTTFFAQIKE